MSLQGRKSLSRHLARKLLISGDKWSSFRHFLLSTWGTMMLYLVCTCPLAAILQEEEGTSLVRTIHEDYSTKIETGIGI